MRADPDGKSLREEGRRSPPRERAASLLPEGRGGGPADPEARLLRVQVDDNGVGIGADRAGGDGLRNAEVRAGYAGGRAEVDRRPEGGTRFVWQVPLPD